MAFSKVVSSVWRPCLFSAIRNRYSKKTKTFHRVCLTILTNFWSHFGSLGQGFLTAVILNKEKVLGTRLIRTSDLGQVYRSTDEKFEPKNWPASNISRLHSSVGGTKGVVVSNPIVSGEIFLFYFILFYFIFQAEKQLLTHCENPSTHVT